MSEGLLPRCSGLTGGGSGGGGGFPEAPDDGQFYLRDGKNKTWKPHVEGTGGTSDHDALENVRIVGEGSTQDALHMTFDTIYGGKPLRPINVYPSDGDSLSQPAVLFTTTAYSNIQRVPMQFFRLQISLEADFNSPVFDQSIESDSASLTVDVNQVSSDTKN